MAYLSVAEYIARYGERETTLFTNEDAPVGGPVLYDGAKVEAMIGDATEEVEGYIARRYAVPLAVTPKLVKGWVAAIARLKLAEATGRVADAIKEAADRATRQLEQLAASRLDLPVAENVQPPVQNGAGAAQSSGDRDPPVFGPAALDGFMSPFSGGAYAPCWRNGS